MSSNGVPGSHAAICAPDVESLDKKDDVRDAFSDVAGLTLSLPEFLMACANMMNSQPQQDLDPRFHKLKSACDEFMRAGVDALASRAWRADNGWVQIGIHPAQDRDLRRALLRRVASLAGTLLGDSDIDNFFYMNKAPGMRLRFQSSAPGTSRQVAEYLTAEVTRWRAEGLIDHVETGVYEPESHLFGGPRSMTFVHALFTVDSLIWLDYHAHAAGEVDDFSPAWLMSLALLRMVLTGLDITGWEDIGVWDHIRTSTGRQLGPDTVSLPRYVEISEYIRDVWSRRDTIADELHPAANALVSQYGQALTMGAARWRAGYFNQDSARMGPRAAAAFYVIFHWNRAALSVTEQAVLAESLAARVR